MLKWVGNIFTHYPHLKTQDFMNIHENANWKRPRVLVIPLNIGMLPS